MSGSNLPVTSREYKLMLNTDRFKDRNHGSQVFIGLTDFLISKEGGTIETQNEEVRRRTSYLDTPELALRQQGFALRLREEKDGFQINLKYRASDRYISAAQDLSTTRPNKPPKFEEDILPPFISKFSHSVSVETTTAPDLRSMEQVTALFPGLKQIDIDPGTPVETINDFKAFEVVLKLRKFKFGEPRPLNASLSFWYLTENPDEWPLVGEFSFDYKATSDGDGLETYPPRIVEKAARFFSALQGQTGWLDPNGTTKTAFALEML